MNYTTLALSIIAGIVFLAVIYNLITKAGSSQGGTNQPQYGPNPPGWWDRTKIWWTARQARQAQNPNSRGIVFWILLIFSVVSSIAAMLVMEYSRAGNLTLTNGVKVSHVAAYLGVILGVLSIVWLNFRCSTWVTKFVGAITAINALILLSMAAWGMYLAGAVAKIKKAHGMNLKVKTGWQEDVTLFVQEHGQGIGMIALAIVVMAVIILFFRSPGARKLGGVILLIAVIGLVLFGGIGYIIRESKAPEPNEIGKWVTAKPNQVTLITVNSQTFTAIEYPSGWDWDISLFNPKGENLEWPSSLVCMKGNQRIEFDRAADPRLPGLPEGKDPVLVKILLPTGMEKMEYQLAVVARKVKTVRK